MNDNPKHDDTNFYFYTFNATERSQANEIQVESAVKRHQRYRSFCLTHCLFEKVLRRN